MNKQGISLVLLKKLVSETERILSENESFREENDLRTNEGAYYHYTMEMAKISGLLAGITNECKLLGGDVIASLRSALVPDRGEDTLNDLLNFYPPTNNGGNNVGN